MKRWLNAAIGGVTVLGLGVAALLATSQEPEPDPARKVATPQQAGADAGIGIDPLTASEDTLTRGIALRSLEGAKAGDDIQYLFAERHEPDKSANPRTTARRADVYLYDYDKDRAIRRVVDLETGKVESTKTFRGQPPIAPDEAVRATGLVLADERLGAGLRDTYEKVTGKPLTSASQVRSQAVRFKADLAVGAKNRQRVSDCGVHRCVQLFIELPNGQWVDTSRLVVDLSTDRVQVLDS